MGALRGLASYGAGVRLAIHYPLPDNRGRPIDDLPRPIGGSLPDHDPLPHHRSLLVDNPLHDRTHDGPDHGPVLHHLPDDGTVLDHPPLDDGLDYAALRDATLHDPALDTRGLLVVVVVDHNPAPGPGKVVFVLVDHPALHARRVEVVIAVDEGVSAADLRLGGRGRHQTGPAECQGREAGKGQ